MIHRSFRESSLALQVINKKLEEAIQIRDDFLSIASHELRTPLTPLKMRLELIQRLAHQPSTQSQSPTQSPTKDESQSKILTNVEICLSSLERICHLIDELLTVSKIRIGQLSLNREEVELCALVKRVVEYYQPDLERKKCPVELHLDPPILGHWDPWRLEEVVVNLLTNAIKFNGGHVIEIRINQQGKDAKLSIRDHGIGIAPKDQLRIFQRFERAVSFTQFGGFGLGLYITRQIIEANGGTIQLESELCKGSLFTVLIPLSL